MRVDSVEAERVFQRSPMNIGCFTALPASLGETAGRGALTFRMFRFRVVVIAALTLPNLLIALPAVPGPL